MKERPDNSEKNSLLKEALTRKGIETVCFDLDDTLIKTAEIFLGQMEKYVQAVAAQSKLDPTALMSLLKQINDRAFVTHAVNPNRWVVVVREMAANLPEAMPAFSDHLPLLTEIYRIKPEFKPGATITLDQFKQTGVSLGLVTHANHQWTQYKIEQLRLGPIFNNRIWIVDEDKHKEAADWQKALQSFGFSPETTMVVGDNLSGDIRAAREIGVRHLVYLPSRWHLYSQGEIPNGTIIMDNIGQLVDHLTAR